MYNVYIIFTSRERLFLPKLRQLPFCSRDTSRHRVGLSPPIYIVKSRRIDDISRYLPCISSVYTRYFSPHFSLTPPPPEVHSKTRGPALTWIISASLGTSRRRQCGGFIHRSVYFRFVLPPFPLVFSLCVAPGFLLHPRASLVAALTHHLLYIDLVETPDIIFDILFCCRRS